MKDGQGNYTTTQWRNNMKLYKLVNVLGAISDTGKLASDMYELGKKRYYSKAHQQEIPVSEMDFQYLVRAFLKLSSQENTKPRDYTLEELRKEKDDAVNEGVHLANVVESLKEDIEVYKTQLANNDTQEYHNLHGKIAKLEELIEEKEELLEKEILQKNTWREAYYDECSTKGSRYIFTEIPNNDYGKKLTRGMKVFLNNDSYTMRVRGQHIKPELKGTGATSWGQSIEQSTHLRVYIDKK
tara:strand:- start:167 stop:889 length:723 start_codon:yes stop_codon:yes gene_type:complete